MKKLLAILFLIPAISFAVETDYIATPILADIQNGADNDNKISTLRVGGQSFLSGTVNFASVPVTTTGIGAKNGATVVAVENGNGVIFKTTLTCTATPVTMTDVVGTVQHGGTKVYDFPQGMILVLGAVIDGVFTGYTSLIDTFDGDVGLGTVVAAGDATLTATEQDILKSTAMTTASGEAAVCDAQSVATLLTESGASWLDGTATAKDLYINFLVDDHNDHGSGTATFTGTIEFVWINLGDN